MTIPLQDADSPTVNVSPWRPCYVLDTPPRCGRLRPAREGRGYWIGLRAGEGSSQRAPAEDDEGRCDMPHTTCAHCGVPIVDHSTMVERGGKTYCCGNCAVAHEKGT